MPTTISAEVRASWRPLPAGIRTTTYPTRTCASDGLPAIAPVELINTSWHVPIGFSSWEMLYGATSELRQVHMQFGLSTLFRVEVADRLVGLAKSIATNDAYRTHGGVDAAGVLKSMGPRWTLRSAYTRILRREFAHLNLDAHLFDEFVILDKSLRAKQANPVCTVVPEYRDARQMVHYHTTNERKDVHIGQHIAAWFDITFGKTPDAALYLHPTQYAARVAEVEAKLGIPANWSPARCVTCNATDSAALPFKKCQGCKVAHYCNRQCQKADWAEHKVTCVPKER